MKRNILFLLLFCSVRLFAQYVDVPKYSSEMYNKRGYYNNPDVMVKGTEAVSDYDGNFMLSYSSHVNISSGLTGEFTIVYNANVSHTVNKPDGTSYPVNAPEWILGYKGIALQTLNLDPNFYFKHSSNTNYSTTYTSSEIPLIIPGYHYGNSLSQTFNDPNAYYDVIEILRSDGSIISLRNMTPKSTSGYYKEQGVNSHGYALVYQPGAGTSRSIYYKPGDGLTYYFEEEKLYFNDYYSNISNIRDPQAIYLKAIFADNLPDESVHFQYTADNNLRDQTGTYYLGRKMFYQMTSNRLQKAFNNLSRYEIQMIYTPEAINIYNTNTGHDYTLGLNGGAATINRTVSNIKCVNMVRQKVNGKMLDDKITYNSYSDQTSPSYRQYTYNYTSFYLHYYCNLIKDISYHNKKKTVLDYCNKFFDGVTSPSSYYYDFYFANTLPVCASPNVQYAFRDCYPNFMLKARRTYDLNAAPLPNVSDSFFKKEEWIYTNYMGDIPPTAFFTSGSLRAIRVDNIFTIYKLSEYLQDDKPDIYFLTQRVKTKKIFSRINTSEMSGTLSYDHLPKLVLMSVQTTDAYNSASVTNTNTYDIGTTAVIGASSTSSYMPGRFDLLSSRETRTDIYGNSTSATTSTNYTYGDQLVFNLINPFSGAAYTKTIDLLTAKTEHDPKTMINSTTFKNYSIRNFNPNSPFAYITYLYATGLVLENKQYYKNNPDTLKSSYLNSYDKQNSGDYLPSGYISKTTYNSATSRPYEVNYKYRGGGTTYDVYDGLLLTKIDSRGTRQDYYYPSHTGTETVTGKVALSNGQISSVQLTHNGYQMQPFKTTTTYSYIPGKAKLRSLSSYSSFNALGQMDFSIDENGYYSNYQYDGLGRLISVGMPGSFTDATNTSLGNKAVIYTIDDINNKVTIQNLMSQQNPVTYVNTINQYDALGHLISVSVQNSSGNYEVKSIKSYNCLDKVINETNFGVTEKHEYDYLGRLLLTTFPDGSTQNVKYYWGNGAFEKNVFTDENGKTKEVLKDEVGNTISEKTGTNYPVIYSYNNIYQLKNVKSPEGKNSTYSYDALGKLISKTTADDGLSNFLYDKYGNIRYSYRTIDAGNNLAFYNYDGLNRLVSTGIRPYQDGLAADNIAAADNDTSKMVLVNIYDIYDKNAYDDTTSVNGTLTVTKGILANMIDPFYWSAGDANSSRNVKSHPVLTAFRDRPGQAWNYKIHLYDVLGRPNYAYIKMGNAPWRFVFTQYDMLGNIIREGIYNVSYGASNHEHTIWTDYDIQGRIAAVKSNQVYNYNNANIEAAYTYNQNDKATVIACNQVSGTKATEVSFQDFEDGTAGSWNAWTTGSLSSTVSHSGVKGWYHPAAQYGLVTKTFQASELNLTKKYTFSGWVKTFSTFPNLMWSVSFTDGRADAYPASVYAKASSGNWQYVELTFDLSQYSNIKSINVYARNGETNIPSNQAECYWDDLRMSPNTAQITTYTYEPKRGWLSSLTTNGSFSQNLLYYNNGNVNTQSIYNAGLNSMVSLSYNYDDMNRLDSINNGALESFKYDRDGNITYRGYTPNKIEYNYISGTNKLSSLKLNDSSYIYSYDTKGNLIRDGRKSISNIIYDRRNLPLQIYNNGNALISAYSYDDKGNRIYKTTQDSKDFYLRDDNGRELAVYDYTTGRLKMINLYGAGYIGRIDVSLSSQWDEYMEEYVEVRTDRRTYNVNDHLGSTRLTIDESGVIKTAYDYFAFGQIKTYYGASSDKYKFTGKEHDSETKYDYFGARLYDSEIGRWLSIDPLADKYLGWSPYNYCLNNPIIFYDPNGEEVRIANRSDGTRPDGFSKEIRYMSGGYWWRHTYQYRDRNFAVQHVIKQLEGMSKENGEWGLGGAHYAPKVANYLNNNDINVALAKNLTIEGSTNSFGNIVLGDHLFQRGGELGAVFLHEVLHKMGKNELEAYAGAFAAGYGDFNRFKSKQEGWYNSLSERQRKKYFKNGILITEMEAQFESEIRRIGNEAIGR